MVRASWSKLPLPVLSLSATAGAALAGNVLIVDAGGAGNFTDIQPAVVAAVDGDAILVKSGIYQGFSLGDKTLSIVADTGASAVVQGSVAVDNLSATRSVFIARLIVRAASSPVFSAHDDLGGLRLEGCTITALDQPAPTCAAGFRALEIVNDADVALHLCTVQGGRGGSSAGCYQVGAGGEALFAHASNLAVNETVLQGGAGGNGVFMGDAWNQSSNGGDGASGCITEDGFLFASGAIVRGGSGGAGGDGGGGCLGTAHGCGGAGGNAVLVNSAIPPTPTVCLFGTALSRGSGGPSGAPNPCFGGPCPGPDGVQISAPAGAVSVIPGQSRSLTAAPVARENTVIPLTFQGAPGDHVWIYFARRPVFSYNAAFHGVNLTPVPPLARLISLGTIPPSGTLSTHIVLPDYGVDSKTHFMQALFRDTANDRFLGSPLTIVELDSAF
jgi:hypothetical protein